MLTDNVHVMNWECVTAKMPYDHIKGLMSSLYIFSDEELPDYIMVLVANKKTKDQMDDDLSLFLGHNTERFTSWLHHVLQKLNAAALLQGRNFVQISLFTIIVLLIFVWNLSFG